MNHVRLVLGVLVAGALVIPASASAAAIARNGTFISYQAAPGEINDVTVTLDAQTLTIRERGTSGDPGPIAIASAGGCTAASDAQGTTATCPAGDTTGVNVELGDQNDKLAVSAWRHAPATLSRIAAGDGDDSVRGGDAQERIEGGSGNDAISGAAGDDTLDGGPGDDRLSGGDDRDLLVGGAGRDVIDGGTGQDLADYAQSGQAVTVALDKKANDGARGEQDNVGDDVEDLRGGSGNDTLVGNARANVLQGGAGADHMLGGNGHDTFDGGTGNDVIQSLDGEADDVQCGDGADGVFADQADVRSGCEKLQTGSPIQVRSRRLTAREGRVNVSLSCSSLVALGCGDPLSLRAGSRRLASRPHYVLRPGQATTLKLRLSKRGRAYVERKHRLRVTLTLVIKDAAGFRFTYTKTLALRA